ncbi:nucleotidyltransferase family protein [Desulfurobacterium thermolithotrophum]|uniref:nucleotidyltransferase family protein n=1 Tax=Desulfurobacterium thermolithotrophum TaxID=64160 RepID=UPI001952C438|nr:nucleotidyltransferase family protein [Desulfurobacterium thermolithotrophum]
MRVKQSNAFKGLPREAMDVVSLLRKNKSYIKSKFHVKRIGIFGSFVRNEQTNSSDIDVLVEFEKGYKDFFNYMRLKHYLESLFKREVDLVIENAVKPQLRKRILNEVVYV